MCTVFLCQLIATVWILFTETVLIGCFICRLYHCRLGWLYWNLTIHTTGMQYCIYIVQGDKFENEKTFKVNNKSENMKLKNFSSTITARLFDSNCGGWCDSTKITPLNVIQAKPFSEQNGGFSRLNSFIRNWNIGNEERATLEEVLSVFKEIYNVTVFSLLIVRVLPRNLIFDILAWYCGCPSNVGFRGYCYSIHSNSALLAPLLGICPYRRMGSTFGSEGQAVQHYVCLAAAINRFSCYSM